MIKVGVLKNESIVFDSVERHLMKNNYARWIAPVSACDGQRTGEIKILVKDHLNWLFFNLEKLFTFFVLTSRF